MKRIAKILLLITIMLVCFIACAKKADDNTSTSSNATYTDKPKSYGKVKLGKYKGIDLLLDKFEVKDEDVDMEIQYLLSAHKTYEEVTNRAVILGDIANIDYEGKKDGVAFEGGSAKAYDLEIGSNSFIPGFEDAIIGMKIGETKDINLTFPKHYHSEDLAGKDVVFTVKLNAIKIAKEAVLDDAWVKEYTNGENKTVDELKASIKSHMQENVEKQMRQQEQAQAMKLVMENSTFEINPKALEYEKAKEYAEIEKNLKQSDMDIETLLGMYNMTKEQFDEQIDKYIKDFVNRKLFIDAMMKKAKIKVKQEDYEYIANSEGISVEELKQRFGEESVTDAAKAYAVSKYIVSHANKKYRDFNEIDLNQNTESQAQAPEAQAPEAQAPDTQETKTQ